MARRWFVREKTDLDDDALDLLNRAVRFYLFGSTKKDVTRDDLSRIRSAFTPGESASDIAHELHQQDERMVP